MNATPSAPPPSQPPIVPSGSPETSAAPREGWAVDAGHGASWWTDAWRLFTAAPVIWIVIALIYVALMIGLHFIPLIGQIAGTILTPVLVGGVMLGCRELDRGGDLTVGHLFAAFNTRLGPLVLLGVLEFAGWIVVLLIAALVAAMAFGFSSLSALWSGEPAQVWAALGIGALIVALVVLLLTVPLVMAFWFAPALMTLRGEEAVSSLKTSFAACLRNIVPFLIYGLLGLVFAIVATIPFGLGWIVLGPVFAASVYTSYKDIFG
jgi:uncharacterized membrane protein